MDPFLHSLSIKLPSSLENKIEEMFHVVLQALESFFSCLYVGEGMIGPYLRELWKLTAWGLIQSNWKYDLRLGGVL